MKTVLLLAATFIGWTIVTGFALRPSRPLTPSKPFILVYERPTEADYAACRRDDNCLDIIPLKDLPIRKDAKNSPQK